MADELETVPGRSGREGGLDETFPQYLHRGRVQKLLERLPPFLALGIGDGEQPVVQAYLRRDRVRSRHPLDRGRLLPFALGRRAARVRVVRAAEFQHLARGRVANDLVAPDEVSAHEARFSTRSQAPPIGRGIQGEIGPIDPDLARQGDLARPFLADVPGPQGDLQLFHVVVRPVRDGHFERPQDRHRPRRAGVQVVTDRVLEQLHADAAVRLVHPDARGEQADPLGRVAAAAHPGDRRHPGIVPAGDEALLHQLEQFPLAHHGVVEVQPRELVLARTGLRKKVVDEPVVDRPVVLELEGADGVRDPLDRVGERVGEIVHRVEAPGIAPPVVRGVADAVQQRVAQLHVPRRHIHLRAQHVRSVEELPRPHAGEQVEVLLHRTVPVRAVHARFRDRAAALPDLVVALAVHVRLPVPDQADRQLIQCFVIIRGEEELLFPVEPEPPHVALDRFDVFHVFGFRVRVVEPHVADAADLHGDAEVDADRLCVADVQEAVRLGGEARHHPAAVHAGAGIPLDDLPEEVEVFPHSEHRTHFDGSVSKGERD